MSRIFWISTAKLLLGLSLSYSNLAYAQNIEYCYLVVSSHVMQGPLDGYYSHPEVHKATDDPDECNSSAKNLFDIILNGYREKGRMDLYPKGSSKSLPIASFSTMCMKPSNHECQLLRDVNSDGDEVDLFKFNYSVEYFERGLFSRRTVSKYLWSNR